MISDRLPLVPRDILDDRLIGSLHLRTLTRDGFRAAPTHRHQAFQVGTISGLLHGNYAGEMPLSELLAHGNFGIGTLEELDGELIVLDGEPFAARASGVVDPVAPTTLIPFAVLCPFQPQVSWDIHTPAEWKEFTRAIDAHVPAQTPIVALRIDGAFSHLHLRSVHRQHPPYPPLTEVVQHQVEWHLPQATGTLVGFRFPGEIADIEIPGFHLHFVSDDRTQGGHVISVTCAHGRISVDYGSDLLLESDGARAASALDALTTDVLTQIEGDHTAPHGDA